MNKFALQIIKAQYTKHLSTLFILRISWFTECVAKDENCVPLAVFRGLLISDMRILK